MWSEFVRTLVPEYPPGAALAGPNERGVAVLGQPARSTTDPNPVNIAWRHDAAAASAVRALVAPGYNANSCDIGPVVSRRRQQHGIEHAGGQHSSHRPVLGQGWKNP